MNASARQSLVVPEQGQKRARSNGDRRGSAGSDENVARPKGEVCAGGKPRVFVAAENRLLREALSRMLVKSGNIEVAGVYRAGPFRTEDLMKEEADILLLTSRGSMNEDLSAIRKVRASAPNVQILLIGVTGEETEFLQCVRAGVSGYLPKSASAEDVVEGVRAVQAGEAVCPGTLCALLFHYFEREATSFPSASAHQRMGLTRREQQIDSADRRRAGQQRIANRFLSLGANGKNHLYRMKHKVGAGDRLGIVQVCRIQGFMVQFLLEMSGKFRTVKP